MRPASPSRPPSSHSRRCGSFSSPAIAAGQAFIWKPAQWDIDLLARLKLPRIAHGIGRICCESRSALKLTPERRVRRTVGREIIPCGPPSNAARDRSAGSKPIVMICLCRRCHECCSPRAME